jgi:hypothetical protein
MNWFKKTFRQEGPIDLWIKSWSTENHGVEDIWIILAAFIAIFILVFTCVPKAHGQRWIDENRGLYPQSLQVTYNYRNTATGFRYGYLLQKVPYGMFFGVSQTVRTNMAFNTYPWERRVTLGGSVTLPTGFSRLHLMPYAGLAYNWHNDVFVSMPGIFNADQNMTNNWGVDIGLQAQIKHWMIGYDVGFLSDILYCQMRAGYTFYRLLK